VYDQLCWLRPRPFVAGAFVIGTLATEIVAFTAAFLAGATFFGAAGAAAFLAVAMSFSFL
jgi:hypothetical protein